MLLFWFVKARASDRHGERSSPPDPRLVVKAAHLAMIRDADVVSIDELRAAREAALFRDDDDDEEQDTSR